MSGPKALILAAGLGTRLRPLTDHVPKALVPLGGRALLDYWIDLLEEAGITEAIVNTHALAPQMRTHIEGINRRGSVRLTEAHEPQLLGSAGTITANAGFADGASEVVVVYADNLSDVSLQAMIGFHRAHGDPLTMMLFHAPNPGSCGIVELDDNYRIASFIEKPSHPRSDLANAGVYVVDPVAYRQIGKMGCFDLGHEVLPAFVGRARGWTWSGCHVDIGTPESYNRAQRELTTGYYQGPRAPTDALRPAVFLDRDGTLIEQVDYLSDPARVRVLPGAPRALRQLHTAGYACVAVTNQSAIGRGLMTQSDYEQVSQEVVRQLALHGIALDGMYHCPRVPQFADRAVVEHCDRKPGPGLLQRAARELGLSLRRSWTVGDMISDVLSGHYARCRGSILVQTGIGLRGAEVPPHVPCFVVPSLAAAADLVLAHA